MATLVNLKRFLNRPTYLDGSCYVPQCSKFFLEKSIKYQLKKRYSKKIFIFKKYFAGSLPNSYLYCFSYSHILPVYPILISLLFTPFSYPCYLSHTHILAVYPILIYLLFTHTHIFPVFLILIFLAINDGKVNHIYSSQ